MPEYPVWPIYELTWQLNMSDNYPQKLCSVRGRKVKSREFYTHIVNMIWAGWLEVL
jgi:hypothetical protein